MNTFIRRLNSALSLVRESWNQRRKGTTRKRRTRRTRLGIECLEDRQMLSASTAGFTLSGDNLYNSSGALIDSGVQAIAGSGGTSVFDLHSNGVLFDMNASGAYTQIDAGVQAIAGSGGTSVFDLHSNGVLFDMNASGAYTQIDTGVTSFAVRSDGDLYVLHTNQDLVLETPSGQHVKDFGAQQSIAMAGDGALFVLADSGLLQQIGADGQLHQVSFDLSLFTKLAATSDGRVYALDTGSELYVYTPGGGWTPVSSEVSSFAVGGNDQVYFLTNSNNAGGPGLVYETSSLAAGDRVIIGSGVVSIAVANNGDLRMENGSGVWYEETTPDQWTFGVNHPAAAAPYSVAQGSLFGPNGPVYQDVEQGQVGDCWLLASLAEVAARAPSDITSMFTYDGTAVENGSVVGVYTVRLYNKNDVPQDVIVDTELPNAGGQYDHPINGVLWVALAEKAYVEANGAGIVTSSHVGIDDYKALNGGDASWALQAITGKSSSDSPINGSSSGSPINGRSMTTALQNMTTAWQNGQLLAVATPPLASTATSAPSLNGVNIVSNHEYAVVGYNSTTQVFTLFNPWGVKGGYEQLPNGTLTFCGGTVTATWQQLAADFSITSTCSATSPQSVHLGNSGMLASDVNLGGSKSPGSLSVNLADAVFSTLGVQLRGGPAGSSNPNRPQHDRIADMLASSRADSAAQPSEDDVASVLAIHKRANALDALVHQLEG
jgi:hypothetical protein